MKAPADDVFMSKIIEAVVISYFSNIASTLGIPIAVLLHRGQDGVDVCIRKNWQPVLAYDKDVDLEFLQSFLCENLENTWRTALKGAENSIRAEQLAVTDPDFDQKLADAMRGF